MLNLPEVKWKPQKVIMTPLLNCFWDAKGFTGEQMKAQEKSMIWVYFSGVMFFVTNEKNLILRVRCSLIWSDLSPQKEKILKTDLPKKRSEMTRERLKNKIIFCRKIPRYFGNKNPNH